MSYVQILIDNGTVENGKIMDMKHLVFLESQKALSGMHALWKAVTKNNSFVDFYTSLGTEVTTSEELIRGLGIVRLLFVRPPPYHAVSKRGTEESILGESKQEEEDHRPKSDATVQDQTRHHNMRANYVTYIFQPC